MVFRPGSDKNDQWGGAIVESTLEREAVVGMSVDRLPMGSNLYAINLGCWFEATRPSHQRFALLCFALLVPGSGCMSVACPASSRRAYQPDRKIWYLWPFVDHPCCFNISIQPICTKRARAGIRVICT